MRARNMTALTEAIKRRHPGVVIYGIGNDAHRKRASDHNEDDTAGSKAAQSDADTNPEHRAIDVMLGPNFSRAQAHKLVADLVDSPEARRRLYYILFDGYRWSRSTGWKRVPIPADDDQHRDHPHISGWAADDENGAKWSALSEEEDMELTPENLRQIALAVWGFKPADHPDGKGGLFTAHAIVLNAHTDTLDELKDGQGTLAETAGNLVTAVETIADRPQTVVDASALAAALTGNAEFLTALAEAVADEHFRRLED